MISMIPIRDHEKTTMILELPAVLLSTGNPYTGNHSLDANKVSILMQVAILLEL